MLRSRQCRPKVPGRFAFPGAQILEFVAFGASGKIFQQFSRNFPEVFLRNPRTDAGNSHSLLEFSEMSSIQIDYRQTLFLGGITIGPKIIALHHVIFQN